MSAPKYLLLFLPVLICVLQACGQHPQTRPGYEEHSFRSMRYGLYTPDGYTPESSYPLLVYLHGSRDTVSRDMRWFQLDFQAQTPCFVLTPKCENPDQGWGNTWDAGHTVATATTLKLIDSLMAVYSIDADRLYLYGISMGGFGVFSILAKEKGKFAAAYAVCGGSDWKAAPQLLDTPLWIFHGAEDDVVPVHLSRGVYTEMIRLGGKKVKYTEYPGVKHNSWENVEREKELVAWLFSKRRKE